VLLLLAQCSWANSNVAIEGIVAFLRIPVVSPERLRLEGEGIYMRAWLVPWEPQWRVDELSRACYYWRLQGWHHDAKLGLASPFFVFRASDDALVGGINIANIRRGVAQDCSIGYWVGKPFARQGYTRKAVQAVVRHAFDDLGLHRVQAGCIPTNFRSRGLLESLAFREEGYARGYLRINDMWQDHVLYARLAGE
jgi:[ribosomal protein S5]-alanine N-acetyltransferase